MTAENAEEGTQLDDAAAMRLLRGGRLEVAGRLVEATNMTLYCTISQGDQVAACVYKPVKGERPLWDFPDGTLANREVAAYEVAVATGWRLVPPRSTATARSVPAWSSSGSTPTPTPT